jgi:hypothetical protein
MLKILQPESYTHDHLAAILGIVAVLILASVPKSALGIELNQDKTGDKSTGMGLHAAPSTIAGSIAQCAQILRGVSDQSEQVKRVRKALKKNLHFRPLGSGHLILRPGWYSDYDDAIAACSGMREDDIPILVSLVGREKQGGSVRYIAIDTLRVLHTKALPCVEAGMASFPERASDFSTLKETIESDIVEISHNPNVFVFNPKSCPLHPVPQKK